MKMKAPPCGSIPVPLRTRHGFPAQQLLDEPGNHPAATVKDKDAVTVIVALVQGLSGPVHGGSALDAREISPRSPLGDVGGRGSGHPWPPPLRPRRAPSHLCLRNTAPFAETRTWYLTLS